jgi:hypothetical protein
MKFLLLLSFVLVLVGANEFKRYDVASGIIKYKTMMKMGSAGMEIITKGTRVIKFKDYGIKELRDETTTTTQKIFGKTTKETNHQLSLMDNGKTYGVDFKAKAIYEMDNIAGNIAGAMGNNMKNIGFEMMKKMGAKKIGTDEVLGYKCDVWDLKGIKQCIYKGVTLKLTTNMGGAKVEDVAIEAKFDIDIPDSEFKLPNYPKKDIGKMMEQMQQMMNGGMMGQ